MRRAFAVAAALLGLVGPPGCGREEIHLEPVAPPSTAAVDPDVVAGAAADHAKDHPHHEALARAEDLAPGDLIVVFANNLDGEIEPCG